MRDSRWGRRLVAASLALLLSGPAAHAQGGRPGEFDPALAEALDQTLQGFAARYGVEGVAAAVVLPGGGAWVGADGNSTDLEPAEPDMVFGIGSGTKTYTAALLLRLAEEGLVNLDEGVGTYLPGLAAYPNIPGSVTLRQLLAHRSGIRSYTAHPGFSPALFSDPEHLFTADEIFAFVGPPLFAPGARWGYSNTNFYLAGLVVEAVTGMSAPEAYADYLFGPLGLAHTRFGWEPVPEGQRWAHGWATNTATGASIDLAKYSPNSNFSAAFTAGGLVATAEDQARWGAALFGGHVVSPASFEQMMTLSEVVTSFPGGRVVGYGLGFFALELGGEPVWAHSGRITGYSGNFGYNPARGVSVAVVANRNGSGNPDAMLAELHAVVAQHLVTSGDSPGTAGDLSLRLVGPNPVRTTTTIALTAREAAAARVEVFDVLGRRVAMLFDGQASAGEQRLTLGASALAPGVYVVRALVGAEVSAVRLVVRR